MALVEDLSERLQGIVQARLNNDALVLPSLPGPAARALEALDQGGEPREVVPHLSRCPLLAVQVLQAAAAGGEAPSSLQEAVAALAPQRLKGAVVAACAHGVFESRDPRIARSCQRLWQHSIGVALLARDLAALSGSPDAELAFLAGLLHDVGKPLAASLLLEAERMSQRRLVDSDTWLEVVKASHQSLGLALAERWGLPAEVVEVIMDVTEFDVTQRSSPANFARFANAAAKQAGLYEGSYDAEDNDALLMIGRSMLDIDDAALERLCANLEDRSSEEKAA
ncbi:MAG TPA: histidine kinase [Planctomycetes bacterium]|nr:histidine kinase [Planctomycetota bacterium]